MTGLRADTLFTTLDDLLALVPNSVTRVKLEQDTQEDYLKVWKFFEENSNPEVVRSLPVPVNEATSFKRTESYLFLFMQRQKISRFFPPEAFKDISNATNLSPRGIKTPFVKGSGADLDFVVFVANGKNAGPLLKAIAQTRAFELEGLLNKFPTVLNALFEGIQAKSKKVVKAETTLLAYASCKLFHEEFLIWNHFESKEFLNEFFCKEPGKLFMNPYGVTMHRPKMSSLSLQGIQNKTQEKEGVSEVQDVKALEGLDIRDTVRNELKLEFYNQKISQMQEGIFVSGDLVARNKDLLLETGITHIINCAGNVCLNYHSEVFSYTTYFIKDSNNFNIECLFYPVISLIETTLESGGKVLLHCMQGVSRSVSLLISYLIYKHQKPYEEVLSSCKEIREICSPNVGFQFQLIWFYKRLFLSYDSISQQPRVFITCSFDPDQSKLVVCKLIMTQTTCCTLDPRTYFLIHSPELCFIWKGNEVPQGNVQVYLDCVERYAGFLVKYEKSQEFQVVNQGEEPQEFWDLWKSEVKVVANAEWNDVLVNFDLDYSEKYETSRSSEDMQGFQARLSDSLLKQDRVVADQESVEVISVESEPDELDQENS